MKKLNLSKNYKSLPKMIFWRIINILLFGLLSNKEYTRFFCPNLYNRRKALLEYLKNNETPECHDGVFPKFYIDDYVVTFRGENDYYVSKKGTYHIVISSFYDGVSDTKNYNQIKDILLGSHNERKE